MSLGEHVSTAGWATVGVSECGGYAAVWSVVDGAWRGVDGTQGVFECDVLETCAISSDIAGTTC